MKATTAMTAWFFAVLILMPGGQAVAQLCTPPPEADTDNDGTRDSSEPIGTATKRWEKKQR